MLPVGSNNGNQILQAPGLVVIRNEMIHEARLIPVDGRPHLGPGVRSYMGDSRGRLERDTLVVDTTNFNGKDTLSMLSDGTRLTERFTRIDNKRLRYEATIDDPRTFTRTWTVSFPLRQDPSYYLFEYACHEGNSVNMRAMLSAARLADK